MYDYKSKGSHLINKEYRTMGHLGEDRGLPKVTMTHFQIYKTSVILILALGSSPLSTTFTNMVHPLAICLGGEFSNANFAKYIYLILISLTWTPLFQ